MDTCTIETGLLKKKPCGQNAVTKCANCEQPLCSKHAVSLMSGGKKTMLCAECAKAWKEQEKTMGAVPSVPVAAKPAEKKPTEAPKAAAPKPAPAAPKPAAAPAPKPAAAAPQAAKKPELSIDETGPLEFTPSKKPDEKK